MSAVHRTTVLTLYRSLLRVGRKMPTENRQQYVRDKAREEFKEGARETDPDRIKFLLRYGETMLDSAAAQQEHLHDLFALSPDELRSKMTKKRKVRGFHNFKAPTLDR